jgi:hypothetical protein
LGQDRRQVTIRQRKGKVCQIRDIRMFLGLKGLVGIGLNAAEAACVDVCVQTSADSSPEISALCCQFAKGFVLDLVDRLFYRPNLVTYTLLS